jgi:hypothetical protein
MPRLSRDRAETGSGVIELALVLPLIALLVMGIIDLGRGAWTRHSLEDAVSDVVRYASFSGSSTPQPSTEKSLEAWIESRRPHFDPDALNLVANWSPDNQPGSEVTVVLTYDFDPLIPLVPMGTFVLHAGASRIISY